MVTKGDVAWTAAGILPVGKIGKVAKVVDEGTSIWSKTKASSAVENAFRHALWQSKLTQDYGKDIARYAGQVHEKNPYAATSKEYETKFTNMQKADETVDLLNNYIGRDIEKNSSNLTDKELSIKVLNVFKTSGLWVVNNMYDENGDVVGYRINREVITERQYDNAINNLKKIDENGYKKEDLKKYRK